jgi:hypothetical protein
MDPKNAVKCAAQKGKCECHVDSLVYYGLKAEDGRLDTSVNYAVVEADHSGYTFCKNDVFGDPLPGDSRKKYCFCDETAAMIGSKISKCAKEGDDCECELGGTIIYGLRTEDSERTLDITKNHWEIDAPANEIYQCSRDSFDGAIAGIFDDYESFQNGGTCFC